MLDIDGRINARASSIQPRHSVHLLEVCVQMLYVRGCHAVYENLSVRVCVVKGFM